MHCPVCKNKDSKVVDSRVATDGMSIRRRRECEKCNYRYSTLEEVELLDLTVVKREGKREAYSREKLSKGLKKALEKRPYEEEDLKKIIHRIERDIQKKKTNELSSEQLGDIVMKHLKGFDKVAYIRFASVYRSFEDVETFEQELKALLKKKKKQ